VASLFHFSEHRRRAKRPFEARFSMLVRPPTGTIDFS
jgi:hypothetical protein